MRQAAHINAGVREAFSQVSSLPFLEALTEDPSQAQVELERQQAEADRQKHATAESPVFDGSHP